MVAIGPHAVDHVIAGAPLAQKLRNHLRRMLEITIDQHRNVALDLVEACGQSDFFTEVARQLHQRYWQPSCFGQYALHRVVTAAVIDHHQLVTKAGLIEQPMQGLQQRHDIQRLVIGRNHTAD